MRKEIEQQISIYANLSLRTLIAGYKVIKTIPEKMDDKVEEMENDLIF